MKTGSRSAASNPRVSMRGFAEYVGASTSAQRLQCVQSQLRNYQSTFRPGADFYQDFITALQDGRQDGTDEFTLQRCVRRQRQDSRASNYAELRRHWLAMPELHLPMRIPGKTYWRTPSLTVSVAPELVLEHGDTLLVTKLWPKRAPLSKDGVKALMWLLLTHMEQLQPGGVPAVLDLRRQKLHRLAGKPFRLGYPELLASEATSMGQLMHDLAESA